MGSFGNWMRERGWGVLVRHRSRRSDRMREEVDDLRDRWRNCWENA